MQTETPEILLVEDDPVDVRLFSRALSKAKPDVRLDVLGDGQTVIDQLLEDSAAVLPKLIVLDIKLPKVFGLDVLARLKADERTRPVPVIMMSSSTQERDIKRAYELGANGYISKPGTFGELSELMQHVVGYWLRHNTPPVLA